MDYKRREEIFSKEALGIKDVQEIFDCSPSKAAEMIRGWKLRLKIGQKKDLHLEYEGKIHILDYFAIMGIDPVNPGERYCKRKQYTVFDELAACDEETKKKIYTYS